MGLMTDTYDDGDITMADEQESGEHDVLIRCTQGEVAKFSAKVRYNSLFIYKSYSHSLYHLRSIHMTNLCPSWDDVSSHVPAHPARADAKIPASRLIEFHSKYGALLKSSLAPHMRKRDKKKEKARAEAKEKKRREVYIDVVMNGAKRGAGHRQRVS